MMTCTHSHAPTNPPPLHSCTNSGTPQVHAVHRCEPPVLDHAAMLGLGLRHIVDFVVRHLEDERVSCVAKCALLTVHWVERVSGGAVCSVLAVHPPALRAAPRQQHVPPRVEPRVLLRQLPCELLPRRL